MKSSDIKDIANKAGVSATTVSYVLNKAGRVSQEFIKKANDFISPGAVKFIYKKIK